MTVRAIRGATCLTQDDVAEMTDAVVELMQEILDKNSLTNDDLVSVFFTATPDLHSAFPAASARTIVAPDVPLICAQEIDVAGAMARVIRVMVHVNSDLPRSDMKHIYLRGAQALRQDIAQ
ncbi:MAG: chorismate mutase [Actinomycetes bacterium]